LWWGHRIPAYKSPNGEWCIGRTKQEAISNYYKERKCVYKQEDTFIYEESDFVQDEDVLDTWFSSGLWPFATMGWPKDTPDLQKYFPGSILETGSDILFFWVARMVMMSLELTGSIPFKQILLHGIVRDAHGRKMSKSLGNVIDPLFVIDGSSLENLIEVMKSGNLALSEIKLAEKNLRKDFASGIAKCGADALRFTLLSYTLGMKDINLDISRVEGYRRLCNKLWNANKFCKMISGDKNLSIYSKTDLKNLSNYSSLIKWILIGRNKAVKNSILNLEKFNFMMATQTIHQFFLYDFCDVFIEVVKNVKEESEKELNENLNTLASNEPPSDIYSKLLRTIFLDILKILHPYLPFITEELYSEYASDTIMYSTYPEEVEGMDEETTFGRVLDVIKILRTKKAKVINILKGTLEESDLIYLRSLVKKTEINLVDDLKGEIHEDEGVRYEFIN
jgi:valyl-tRNA synthetase